MPSPLAHATAAVLVSTGFGHRNGDSRAVFGLSWPALVAASMFFSLLPDLPTALGLFSGNLAAFHNRAEHSLVMGLAVSALVALMCSRITTTRWGPWFGLVLACYWLHVAMDFLTVGRGVQLLWPFSSQRFGSPIKLFYGLHWSDGWISSRHLWTVMSEIALMAGFGCVIFWCRRIRRKSREP